MTIPANRRGLPTIGSLKKKIEGVEPRPEKMRIFKRNIHASDWVHTNDMQHKIDNAEVLAVEITTPDFWYSEYIGVVIDVVDFDQHNFACAVNNPIHEIRCIKKEHCKIIT